MPLSCTFWNRRYRDKKNFKTLMNQSGKAYRMDVYTTTMVGRC